MSFSAAQQNLLSLPSHTCFQTGNRSTLFSSRVRQGFLALLLALVPVVASAQVGREFVSAEAYVGVARVVYVGKILEIKQIEYGKPLTDIQKLGKPYRLVFEVSETIRGDEVKRLELVLSLQSTIYLEYMLDHSAEIMLVSGPTRLDSFPTAEVGIEEQGKRMDDERYQFRLLDPVEVPKSGDKASIASQINLRYDSCRMFTNELEIVVGREAILKRARAFAKQHPKVLSAVSLRVPNEFGALCADPNAFCMITLPICPETKTTLVALKDDPGLILRRIESRDDDVNLSLVLVGAHKALAMFPDGSENLASGQSKTTPQTPDSPGEWETSGNGDLSLRLRVKSARLATQESIVVIAEMRNNRQGPVTILRPFGWHQLIAHASQLKIWGEQGQIKYKGPIADYELDKASFITLAAKEITTDTLELTVSDFAATGKAGNYAVRYDYSYSGEGEKKVADEGVKGIWRGTICSREVQLKKQEAAAEVPRPSQETVLFRSDWKNGNRAKVTADLVALLKEGMTKDQVTSILERPSRLSDGIAQDGNSEKWTFTISLGRILILTFEGDKLITIDGG